MKILVVSDTHRKDRIFYDLVDEIKPDMVIHCGDTEGSEDAFERSCKCPFVAVKGNNDFFSGNPYDRELKLFDTGILVTHGHMYNVSSGLARLVDEALDRDCKIVLFGHTHVPVIYEKYGVTVVNPGSLGYPRQFGHCPSYTILEIDEHGYEFYPKEIEEE
ncbi:MAG: metallophosphoesterase [Lachnospiraceae bacterium]|nr:metallophosphoesterase [Lachnospiraceae bacterium]